MTVWEHLVANSTLTEGAGDAWEHLINPSGTGGAVRFVPYTDLAINTGVGIMSVNIETSSIDVNIETSSLEVNIEKKILEVDIIDTKSIEI